MKNFEIPEITVTEVNYESITNELPPVSGDDFG